MSRGRTLKEYAGSVGPPVALAAGGATSTLTGALPGAQPELGIGLFGLGLIGTAWTAFKSVRFGRARRRAQLDVALVDFPPQQASKCDRHKLGVGKSTIVTSVGENEDAQPYIARDVDAKLDRALGRDLFVVVRGASKAGKSRTAFEAIVRRGDPLVLAARKGAAIADIALNSDLLPSGPAVVWLDKLDGYVRAGLFDTVIRDLLLDRGELTIVGTIEDSAWDLIVNADGHEKGSYEAGDVLRSASIVRVGQASADELQRARELYPAEVFEPSIGAHFVAARALRDRYLAANPPLTAIVRAVVDWQRTGTSTPIPRRALESLYVHYLDGAEAGDLFEQGIAWANEADGSGARLLDSRGWPKPEYSVPDHIVDWLTKTGQATIRDEAWEIAIENADADAALAIGGRALELHDREALDLSKAQRAFESARGLSKPGTRPKRIAATRLALLMRRQGRDDLAETYFQEAIENESMVAGNNYGFMLMQHDRYSEAKPILAQAVARGSRTAAFNLLETLAELDAIDEAEDLLGMATEQNPAAALMLGNVRHRDDLDGADRLYRMVEAGNEERDAGFRRRAVLLRALIAEDEGCHDEADRLYRDASDVDEWELIAERLDHVGLRQRLTALREQVAVRIDSAAPVSR
jgi:Tfp pilus assembly protein PilF